MNIYCIHEPNPKYADRKQQFLQRFEQLLPISTPHQLIWVCSYDATWFQENAEQPENLYHSESVPSKSCFWKHYDAFKRIAQSGEVGLVLEDDAIFFPNLLQRCQDLLHSMEQHGDNLFYINMEYAIDDVPIYYWRHRLVKMDGTKKTGAYLLSPQAAQKLAAHLDDALQNQQTINLPADWWITQKHQQIGINTYWAVHPLVWQGSKTGRFASDLSLRQFSVFYGVYEKIQRHFMPTFNKIRACFRKKIRQRVHYPVK